jgi:phage shock protein C
LYKNVKKGGMMKRLYRSKKERKISGICGGLAEYFNIDPVIVRLIVILLCLITGILPILIAYIVAHFIIPEGSS